MLDVCDSTINYWPFVKETDSLTVLVVRRYTASLQSTADQLSAMLSSEILITRGRIAVQKDPDFSSQNTNNHFFLASSFVMTSSNDR